MYMKLYIYIPGQPGAQFLPGTRALPVVLEASTNPFCLAVVLFIVFKAHERMGLKKKAFRLWQE